MDYVVTKWHINRLSGNHKQGDYKKTTEYLDSHAVNTIDLIISDNLVGTCNGGINDTTCFLYDDYLKLKDLLFKCVLHREKIIVKQLIDNPRIVQVKTWTCPVSFSCDEAQGTFTFDYIYGGNEWDIKWFFRNKTVLDYANENNYSSVELITSELIAIGTGDLEIVIDDVEEMPEQ